MLEKKALLIFPHQCFEEHEALTKDYTILLIEAPYFFDRFTFHKQKLIFHRATLKAYEQFLIKKKLKVIYFDYTMCSNELEMVFSFCKKEEFKSISYIDVIEKELDETIKKFSKVYKFELIQHNSPSFLLSTNDLPKTFETKKHYLMASFYTKMRKIFKILVNKNKPMGGKWSFDDQNREPFPKNVKIPKGPKNNTSPFVTEAKSYSEKHFPNNPGNTDIFIYPVTHKHAKLFLNNFLKEKLKSFGPYQDAIDPKHPFGFHSILSPLINSGLLTPDFVINTTLSFGLKNKIPLNSLEGFIRQILGWREFVRGVYNQHGKQQKKSNFLKHTISLPSTFWNATTKIYPIDCAIQNILQYAYAHHIERLMILGNFMLIGEIKPDDVYRWFMEMFIDSYDWVMIPNVYGMSQYADGGLMTTKPYCSSSRYILKMSCYKKEEWCNLWDALYWNFIYKHALFFKNNKRLFFVSSALKKMDPQKLKNNLLRAQKYLKQLSSH